MKPIDTEPLFRDGLHYDALNNIEHDLPFWLEHANGSVLELACGTGRISIPMAKMSLDVTGVDISKGMLTRAKEKAEEANVSINFIEGDFRNVDLNKKFDTIICPFNSFQHLHDLESMISFLNVVKAHLKPEGKFIFDIFNPDLNLLLNNDIDFPAREYMNPYFPDEKVIMKDIRNYDKVTQINHITRMYTMKGERKPYMLNMRVYFPAEIDNYLIMNGFKILSKYGSFQKEEFNSDSGKQIFVCGQ